MQKTVMVVGEFWGEQEELKGKAFAGPAGGVLSGLLAQAGISSDDCFFTNVINKRPPSNSVRSFYGPKADAMPNYRPLAAGKFIDKKYAPEISRLFEELERTKPNVIIALGNLPLWALCKKTGIRKYRGSPLPTFDNKYKVIPTWNPSSILRQWELRAVTLADFSKANLESEFPEIRRPVRYIYLEPQIEELWEFYHEFLENQPYISCDIETKLETITEVGFGTADGQHALVVPFWTRTPGDGNYWNTLKEERAAWDFVRHVITKHKLIGQNFSYDMQYFWRTVKMPCPHFIGDTMLLHHSLQPELEKGLGFLGSIYTNEPSWKFMRTDHSTLKRGDE